METPICKRYEENDRRRKVIHMYKYTLLKADGTKEDLGTSEEEMKLSEMQKHVGGYIELVPPFFLPSGYSEVYCDEEGRLKAMGTRLPNKHTQGRVLGDLLAVEHL